MGSAVSWWVAQQYSDITAAPTPGRRGQPDHRRFEAAICGMDNRCGWRQAANAL